MQSLNYGSKSVLPYMLIQPSYTNKSCHAFYNQGFCKNGYTLTNKIISEAYKLLQSNEIVKITFLKVFHINQICKTTLQSP